MKGLPNFSSDNYLRAAMVLTIDTITSMIASVFVMVFSYIIGASWARDPFFLMVWGGMALLGSILGLWLSGAYKLVIRFSTLRDFGRLCMSMGCKEVLLIISLSLFQPYLRARIGVLLGITDFLTSIAGLLLIRVVMLVIYKFSERHELSSECDRILIYGVSDKAVAMLTRLSNSSHYKVEGFLYHGHSSPEHKILMGKRIYRFQDVEDLSSIVSKHNIQGILFPYLPEARMEKNRLISYCLQLGLKTFISSGINELKDGKIQNSAIRNIKIEDLLGRSEIEINMQEIRAELEGKTVLVTGAAGSIGSELCRQLAGLGIRHLIMFDSAETPLHDVRLEFEETFPELYFSPIIGDVRNIRRLDYVFQTFKPDIVFHAAAYKHVPLMEENPCEAVLCNVTGSKNVADKCVQYDVEKMVMISTDKAVNPTNVMGCSKRLAEIYVQSLGLAIESGEATGCTTFITTRFGNVLGSSGSVILRFTEQIKKGGPVTVTHPEITRYFMTIPEACRLVLEAAAMADGTQLFAFDMGQPVKIDDLARKMISLAGYQPDVDIEVQYTGLRPGEKLYEEVLASKENTIPTNHKRIFRAKVRQYEYLTAREYADTLREVASTVDITSTVRLMKEIVPEYISNHSEFEKLD